MLGRPPTCRTDRATDGPYCYPKSGRVERGKGTGDQSATNSNARASGKKTRSIAGTCQTLAAPPQAQCPEPKSSFQTTTPRAAGGRSPVGRIRAGGRGLPPDRPHCPPARSRPSTGSCSLRRRGGGGSPESRSGRGNSGMTSTWSSRNWPMSLDKASRPPTLVMGGQRRVRSMVVAPAMFRSSGLSPTARS